MVTWFNTKKRLATSVRTCLFVLNQKKENLVGALRDLFSEADLMMTAEGHVTNLLVKKLKLKLTVGEELC